MNQPFPVVFFNFLAYPWGVGASKTLGKGKSNMENTLNLAIEGMHCGACVRRVTSALQSVEGATVKSVEIGSAEIVFDAAEMSAQDITAKLDRNGFPARVQS
jgi:copper chaperone